MADFNDIVDVQSKISTVSGARPSFGIPLLIGYHVVWVDDFVRLYGSPDEMLDDGFATTHYLYQAALILASQSPSPNSFMIGRRVLPLTQTIQWTPAITTPGYKYTWTVAGSPDSYVNGNSETTSTIATAISAKLDLLARVGSSAAGPLITTVATTPGDFVDFSAGPGLTQLDTTADTTTGSTYAAIDAQLDGNPVSWYGATVCDSFSKATALLDAAYVESKKKMSFVQSPDDANGDPSSTTDTGAAIQNAAYTRTLVWYKRNIGGTEWLAVSQLAGRLAVDPGQETWAFRQGAGVQTDAMKTAFISALQTKNVNFYAVSHSEPISWEGKAGSGQYGDVTRFVDWQDSTIDFNIFGVISRPPKTPYTTKGLNDLGLSINLSLEQGVDAGGIADDTPYTVTVPALSSTTTSDRSNRIGRGFKYAYRLAGALHQVFVQGTITE